MKSGNMILHCGAGFLSREELEKIQTPAATRTFQPIPHTLLVDQVKSALVSETIEVTNEAHSTTTDGMNYFGLLEVSNRSRNDDFAYVVGLRNSHTFRYPAGLVIGAHVFVCDNLSFSGEIQVARKHTRYILRDLHGLTVKAVGYLAAKWMDQEKRIEGYRNYKVNDAKAHDLVVRALDARALTVTQIPAVLAEYRNPRHEEFAPRTAWSWFNSVTEVLKEVSIAALPSRTQALHGLLDHQCGLLDNLAKDARNN
jgi:hypothetical protein